MSRPFVSGQRYKRLPARLLNEAVALREEVQSGIPLRPVTRRRDQHHIIWVKNGTDDDLDQFHGIGWEGSLIDPTDNEQAFRGRVIFEGEATSHDKHLQDFAVAIRPIPKGRVGPAVFRGTISCKVDVVNVEHQFVRVKDNESGLLETCGAGGGRVLYPRPFGATGEQWATISIEPFGGTGYGYLKGYLGEAPVSGTPATMTPSTADATVYTFDSSGDWSSTDDDIFIHNPWEDVSGNAGHMVSFVMHAGRWLLTGVSCNPTQIDL